MASTMVDVAVGGGAVAVSLLLLLHRRRQPPSTVRYPVIGSLYRFPEPWYQSLHEQFSQHPVVILHVGLQKVYVFNHWSSFKEAMIDNSEKLSGRLENFFRSETLEGDGGVSNLEGALWSEYRKFTLRLFRELGVGGRAGKEMMAIEAEHLCRTIDNAEGAPLSTTELMGEASGNIISQLLFGCRLASEDPKFFEILKGFHKLSRNKNSHKNDSFRFSVGWIVKNYPVLLPIFKLWHGSKDDVENFEKIFEYCEELKQSREAEMQALHKATDYIDACLMNKMVNPKVYSDQLISHSLVDLFFTGTEPLATTLVWAILYLIDNPHVADKMHQEIVDCIGRERMPQLKDKPQLMYSQAVIEEILRCSTMVPLGLMHRVTDKVTVAGYELEKDALCLFNAYHIHHDPEFFPNPTEFRPERHLMDGKFVGCERLAAFGLGKRSCMGQTLARMELFVFLTTLVQRYRFSLDPEDTRTVWDITEDPQLHSGTLARVPAMHKVVFQPR